MSRRTVVAALIGLLVAAIAVPSSAQVFQATLSGREVTLSTQPVTVGSTVLVPLRESLVAIGATDIRFVPSTNQITFMQGGSQVMIDLNTNVATIDGQSVQLAGTARVLNGVSWVPAEFVSSLEPGFALVRVRGFRAFAGDQLSPIPQPFGPGTFTVGGQTFSYASPTWYMGGVLMVPLDETLQALGIAPSTVNPDDLQASFIWNNQIVRLNVESGFAHIGNTAFAIDRPVVVRGDTVYVPASFFGRIAPAFQIAGMRVAGSGSAVLGFREGSDVGAGK
jgi:hypothetical protein